MSMEFNLRTAFRRANKERQQIIISNVFIYNISIIRELISISDNNSCHKIEERQGQATRDINSSNYKLSQASSEVASIRKSMNNENLYAQIYWETERDFQKEMIDRLESYYWNDNFSISGYDSTDCGIHIYFGDRHKPYGNSTLEEYKKSLRQKMELHLSEKIGEARQNLIQAEAEVIKINNIKKEQKEAQKKEKIQKDFELEQQRQWEAQQAQYQRQQEEEQKRLEEEHREKELLSQERIEIERLKLEQQKLAIAEERKKRDDELQIILLRQQHELALAKEKTRQDEIKFAREQAKLRGIDGNIRSLKDYQQQQAKK